MKIIFCLHHFLPEYVAGTEIYTLRLAQILQGAGAEMIILIPRFDNAETDEYIYEGVRVIRYGENSVEDRSMIMGKKMPDGMGAFLKVLKNEQPDIVHFHEMAPGRGINIFHAEQTRLLQIPVVLTFHLSYYTCIKNSLFYKNEKKCDGVIREKVCTECVYHQKNIRGIKAILLSNTAMALFNLNINPTRLNKSLGTAIGFPFVIKNIKRNLIRLEKVAEKIVVIAGWYKEILEKNGMPSSKLIYIKQGLTSGYQHPSVHKKISGALRLVYIGRITESKGLHLLIEALCRIPEDKVSLHIYGKQTETKYINTCRQLSGTNKNICWKGVVPSEEVIPTLSNYDLLCLPSVFSEMSPLVIQEAFAAGIPVLASNVYGNVEQITEEVDGWLFRFNDPEHLYQKLVYLIDNTEVVENAALRLPTPNSFSRVGENHLRLYESILADKKELAEMQPDN